MKIKPARFAACCLFLWMISMAGGRASAGSIAAPYQVGTWQGFRPGALSFTFDDSCANQFTIAIPMFNQKGLKMTLFSCTGVMFAGWPKLQSAAAQGHEIASHTVTHRDLPNLSDADQLAELTNSQNAINANVTNQMCVTLAYPDCKEGNDTLTSAYYFAARGCSGQNVPKTLANFMNISSFVCGALGSISTLAQFTNQASSAANSSAWCVYLIHGIDNDGGYSPLPSANLQQVVNFFSTNQDRFWIQTFGNVARYIKERSALSVVEVSSNSDSISLSASIASANLDSRIFNYPVTLRRPLPAGWPGAVVSQNSAPVTAQKVQVQGTNYVMFDVVPDAGSIVISKMTAPAIASPALSDASHLGMRLDGQAGARYVIFSSTNLQDWQPLQTNILTDVSTNLSFGVSNAAQYFRAQGLP